MRILIVEDHEPTRSRLAALLTLQGGYQVTAAVDTAEKALNIIDENPPDLAILDLGLPGLAGAEAISAIKSRCPSTNILVFTVMENDDQVFSALRAGASGYLLKDAPAAQIVESIEEIRSGGAPMSFPIARKVLSEFRDMSSQRDIACVVSPLSKREIEILECLYKGDSYKEIAAKLTVSIHTVHTHIKNIYEKLHAKDRPEALVAARRKGII